MTIHLSLFLGYNMQAQSPQYEVTWLIRRVFRAMAQLADSYLRAHGLSAADRAVLEFLYPDGALSVPEIAARYQVSRQHVQVTVNTLLDDGFLQSRPNPRHKRSPLFALTHVGRELFARCRPCIFTTSNKERLMSHFDIKHLLIAGVALSAIAMTGLWSWNTLAELFGAPEAQFRHAIAALALLATLRLAIPHRRTAFRRHRRP
jgi:DNA-binding MarR family transcriptional regulator